MDVQQHKAECERISENFTLMQDNLSKENEIALKKLRKELTNQFDREKEKLSQRLKKAEKNYEVANNTIFL